MQTATTGSIVASRAKLCRVTDAPLLPRLWQLLRYQWQCAADRAAERAVRTVDHPGVAADYRMAVRARR